MNPSGHFLLYKNTKYAAEVQIKTKSCNADYTSVCTCAAAIEAGGDVFLFDICSSIKRATFSHCRGNILNVREVHENNYDVSIFLYIYGPYHTNFNLNIFFCNKYQNNGGF